jgi:hypothetical protein
MFRLRSYGQEPIVNVDTVEQIEPVIPAGKLGLYDIDEITRDALPSGHTSRRWGVGIKRADGSVVIERDPWEE